MMSLNSVFGLQVMLGLAPMPLEDRLAGPLQERAVLPECSSSTPNWRSVNNSPGSSSGTALSARSHDAVDGEGGGHLDDEAGLTLERRIAARPHGRAHVSRELRLQVFHQQIDPELGHPFGLGVGGGEMLAEIGVRTRDDVHRDKLAHLVGGLGAGFGRCLHRTDIAADDDRHQPVAHFLTPRDGRRWPPSPWHRRRKVRPRSPWFRSFRLPGWTSIFLLDDPFAFCRWSR